MYPNEIFRLKTNQSGNPAQLPACLHLRVSVPELHLTCTKKTKKSSPLKIRQKMGRKIRASGIFQNLD
jgi:hypothetical protein